MVNQAHFENTKQDAGAILINNKTRHIALIKMHHNVWGFPKGGIIDGETALEAAKRKVAEETGINNVKVVKELPEYERGNSYTLSELLHIHMFIFITDEDNLNPNSLDIAEAKWVAPADVIAKLSLPEDQAYFGSVQDQIE